MGGVAVVPAGEDHREEPGTADGTTGAAHRGVGLPPDGGGRGQDYVAELEGDLRGSWFLVNPVVRDDPEKAGQDLLKDPEGLISGRWAWMNRLTSASSMAALVEQCDEGSLVVEVHAWTQPASAEGGQNDVSW